MVICFLCTKKNNNDIVIDHQLIAIIAMIIAIRNQWIISENIEDLLENISTYHEENEENASPNQWPSIVEANSMKNKNCLRDYFCYFFVIFYSVCFSFVLCVCELWLRNRKIHISWKSAACHSDMENAGKYWKTAGQQFSMWKRHVPRLLCSMHHQNAENLHFDRSILILTA